MKVGRPEENEGIQKFPSPFTAGPNRVASRFSMIKPLTLSVLLVFAAATSGCTLFKKSNQPKESSAIASDVEETFRRRWMEQRVGQVVAQGATPDAARVQAETEFRERFAFAGSAKK